MAALPRVESKHLFNYCLTGVCDEEVAAEHAKAMQKFTSDQSIKALLNPAKLDCQEMSTVMRRYVTKLFKELGEHPSLVEAVEGCTHTNFEVPPRDGNDYSVPVLVHTPMYLAGQNDSKKGNAAMIYAHGGGAVSGTAEEFKPWLSDIAVKTGIVVFNVDYRLAPETKCPKNALDFYCAVKHVIENASDLGIDQDRISICGVSGGGYIVMAAMIMLAKKDEGHLVKLALPCIPMIDDYEFGDPNSMTKEERDNFAGMRKVWECLATDLEEQRQNSDPLLFPAKAPDELLAKMPPTIIWEVEFDFFITAATRMANRLRAAGRLLEFYVAPGVTHGGDINPDLKVYHRNIKDMKLALEAYLF